MTKEQLEKELLDVLQTLHRVLDLIDGSDDDIIQARWELRRAIRRLEKT